MTQTEAITWSVLAFFYLLALLVFVRAILRGPRPIHWRSLRFGVFVDRDRANGDHEDEPEP